jgi:hypothetical protein
MNAQEKVEQFFEKKGVSRGSEPYLRVSDAQDLLPDLADAGRAVVGVEGVELRESETRPLSGAIADFSDRPNIPWRTYVRRCAAQAKEFLNTLPDRETVYVTLTTPTRDVWKQCGAE